MSAARDFINVYRLYKRFQPRSYAIKAAWRIAVRGLPF
jgi:hypothetical protein